MKLTITIPSKGHLRVYDREGFNTPLDPPVFTGECANLNFMKQRLGNGDYWLAIGGTKKKIDMTFPISIQDQRIEFPNKD